MAEELAASLDGEVQMIDRSVLTVNEVACGIPAVAEAAVRGGRVGRTFALALPQLYTRRACHDCSLIRGAKMTHRG